MGRKERTMIDIIQSISILLIGLAVLFTNINILRR